MPRAVIKEHAMNHSPLSVVECRRAKRTLLSAALVGATSLVISGADVSAQQTNPFVKQNLDRGFASVPAGMPHQANTPVAQARLQMPQVGASNAVALSGVTPTLNTPRETPATAAIGHARPVHVGPDWAAFTPQSFSADSVTPQPQPTLASSTPKTVLQTPTAAPTPQDISATPQVAMRPSRLPAADSGDYSSNLPVEVAPHLATTQASLASAAQQRSRFVAATRTPPTSGAAVYLASQTAQSQIDEAAKLFRQASLEYDCAAYASAETSAWDALEKAAQAIDLSAASNPRSAQNAFGDNTQESCLERLHRGRRAIIEAQDFVGPFAQENRQAISRLARAHQTPIVRETLPPMTARYSAEALARFGKTPAAANDSADLPTASEAVDRYLDFARTKFSVIAGQSLLAAQTMDLLAAIRLGRAQPTQLPGPTAICLRRAAVQGQSDNADLVAKLGHHLADIGLIDEARWALGHSLTLQHNPTNAARLAGLNATATRANSMSSHGSSILAATRPRMPQQQPNRVPEITTVSPQQFAAISHSVIPGSPERPEMASQSLNQARPNQTQPTDNPTEVPFQNEMQYQSVSATTSSPKAPSPRSFFRAMTASFKSPTARVEPPTALPPNVPNQLPSNQLAANSIAQPYGGTPAYGSNPASGGTTVANGNQAAPTEPEEREGRISSRLLPGIKKWW